MAWRLLCDISHSCVYIALCNNVKYWWWTGSFECLMSEVWQVHCQSFGQRIIYVGEIDHSDVCLGYCCWLLLTQGAGMQISNFSLWSLFSVISSSGMCCSVQALLHDMQGIGLLCGSFSDWKMEVIVKSIFIWPQSRSRCQQWLVQWGLLQLCGFILKIVMLKKKLSRGQKTGQLYNY